MTEPVKYRVLVHMEEDEYVLKDDQYETAKSRFFTDRKKAYKWFKEQKEHLESEESSWYVELATHYPDGKIEYESGEDE